ncbi:deoxyribose-phosphate aldolase [Flavobacterium facile]|uniref:deoxyribose-phosphate aldolase n=1 Tax=Flavobacterium facile TaxID=2893174 RepID=UPI002E7810D7|nr:deoxyribose-phosphate aldolase [Flavobacterium sp. T-12]
MNIKHYLDSTYLKTAEQAKVSEKENVVLVQNFVQETIDEKFKLVMIRPDKVALAKKLIENQNSKVLIGTVIGFPEGTNTIEEKLTEAQQAINHGADELDFVVNFEAFKLGEISLVKEEVFQGTQFALQHNKTVKWIIEIAALNGAQIIQLTSLIKNVVVANFKEKEFENVFVKSSTGFYKTLDGLPNGATFPAIIAMLENAFPLPVKASGGIKTKEEALEMIKLGVKRIGTSSAKAISEGVTVSGEY